MASVLDAIATGAELRSSALDNVRGGVLYLRQGLADEDPFAADIARQVLDLPESSARRERWT